MGTVKVEAWHHSSLQAAASSLQLLQPSVDTSSENVWFTELRMYGLLNFVSNFKIACFTKSE